MSEIPYNPDDLAFLVSRSLDEELPEADRRRLDDALASSESLRGEAEQFRNLARLVQRWAAEGAELDWEHHHALISAQAAGEDDSEASRKLDGLLARWGASVVPLDEKKFTNAVMTRIDPRRARKIGRRLVFRLGVPLAAAAMVALALTGRLWFGPPPASVSQVVFGKRAATTAGLTSAAALAVAVVSFAREPVDVTTRIASAGMSFGSAGATPLPVMPEDAPPL